MKNELSILIPVYNEVCTALVTRLGSLCERRRRRHPSFMYEIIVADDASSIRACVEANKVINVLRNCRFIAKDTNTGSAATRNFLARESCYRWLLFLDCDMQIGSDDFIDRYAENDNIGVVNGGIAVGRGPEGNLRFLYEKREEKRHTAELREQQPYRSFRSTNFLIERSLMLRCPFDERFKKSGYEDVSLGKKLRNERIPIYHIDNPTLMVAFEDNPTYMDKIDRSLQTLYTFRNDLRGYSRMLNIVRGIHVPGVHWAIRLFHRLFGSLERRHLCGNRPSLRVFDLYRLGYYLNQEDGNPTL